METLYIPFESQKRLIELSRRTLECFVCGWERQSDDIKDPYLLSSEHGAFVTLYKGTDLRGCIGTCFPTRPLVETVMEMTRAAASQDYRFQPVSQSELPEIAIDISALSPLELVHDPLSLKAGDHPPNHVHIYKGDQFIGRFDIENERPMDGKLPGQVLRFLEELGYKKAQKG